MLAIIGNSLEMKDVAHIVEKYTREETEDKNPNKSSNFMKRISSHSK